MGGGWGKTIDTTNSDSHFNSQNTVILKAAVNQDPNPSKGGGEITIVGDMALLPETGPLGSTAGVEKSTSHESDQIGVYVVREGDSLSQIAKMFGVSTNTMIWANDLGAKGLIHTGQTLVVLPVTGVSHTVKEGETLAGIVKKYDGNIEEVKQFNGITEDSKLSIGDKVIIPGGEAPLPTSSSNVSPKTVRGAGGPAYNGYYIWPVDGGRKTQGLHGYNAVDIGAPNGTPIFAAASGEVIVSKIGGWNGGYGTYIVIKHQNGTQTVYGHNSNNIVSRGWNVVQGQVIGYVGSTGNSTGPHVHFEVRGAKNPY